MIPPLYDSFGNPVSHGDILACPGLGLYASRQASIVLPSATRYFAVYAPSESDNSLESTSLSLIVRDLLNGAIHTYHSQAGQGYYNAGPYYMHLEKLSDSQLMDYFHVTREQALAKRDYHIELQLSLMANIDKDENKRK